MLSVSQLGLMVLMMRISFAGPNQSRFNGYFSAKRHPNSSCLVYYVWLKIESPYLLSWSKQASALPP